MEKYLEYAQAYSATEKVISWIKSTLKNYLIKETPIQDEVEHIIDYLQSDEAPKNIAGMSYKEAKTNTEKWNKTLIKKGSHIKELPTDTEIVLDFKDGFKIVKLVGKNAYDREGYLMRHCVASYFGKSTEIYSLRDKENMPHCTMEKDQQIKGKGNGDIHPNYVEYVVKFLEHVGMTVGDNEMSHLGYINMEKFKKELSKKTKYFNKKYLPKNEKLIGKDGKEFACLELLNVIPLISKVGESIKINFELPTFIKLSFEYMRNTIKVSKNNSATSGNDAHSATSGNDAHSATSGNDAHSATSGNDAHSATSGNDAHSATSGDRSHSATSGNDAHSATSGNDAHSATSGNDAHSATSGDRSHSATSGDRSNSATSGYGSDSATSGNDAHSATSGDRSNSATSGYGSDSATSGNDAHSATSGDRSHSATSGNDAHSATSGNDAHSATSGNDAHSATSGNDAHSATSGNDAHSATSGDRSNSATSGYGSDSATSGNDAHSATSGDRSHSATSGNDAHSATSGNDAHSATSGDRSHSATSGDRSHSATSGNDAHSATSGNDAHSATSGDRSHSATSGDRSNSATSGYGSHSATSGNDGIACSIGRKAKAKASLGCWIVLAEWEEGEKFIDAKPICIKSAQIDGKKIKADQWYKLVDGKFVETDDAND